MFSKLCGNILMAWGLIDFSDPQQVLDIYFNIYKYAIKLGELGNLYKLPNDLIPKVTTVREINLHQAELVQIITSIHDGDDAAGFRKIADLSYQVISEIADIVPVSA